jgi:hypothetical protein
MSADRIEVECPVSGCRGIIPIRPELPAGEYDCLCRAARIHLSWAQYIEAPHRRPYLVIMSRMIKP